MCDYRELNMNISEKKITQVSTEELVTFLLNYLEGIESEWDHDKIFIDGEYDSNQTKFEKLSNYMKIGVVADSKEKGYLMLFLLRTIIDKRSLEGIWCWLEDDSEEINILADVVERLAEAETAYTDIFEPGESLETILYGPGCGIQTKLKVKKEDVDLWDYERIKKEIVEKMHVLDEQ